MADFVADIEKFVKSAKDKEQKFVREFVQDLAEAVVRETPVKTGFLRGSWFPSIGAPDIASSGAVSGDPMGRISVILSRLKPTDVFFFTNTAKYARFVEFGTSKMSPRAFVRRVMARAESIAAATLERVKNG